MDRDGGLARSSANVTVVRSQLRDAPGVLEGAVEEDQPLGRHDLAEHRLHREHRPVRPAHVDAENPADAQVDGPVGLEKVCGPTIPFDARAVLLRRGCAA
jgi:hypothetical protein